MIVKRTATNRGFTLVELLLVIVLIAILMALVTLSGFNMVESTNAQAEARRIIRTVHALRSAWLASYADTQKMVGIPEDPLLWPSNDIEKTLSRYSDRSLSDETNRYGQIQVRVNSLTRGGAAINGTYIGFRPNPSNQGIWGKSSASSKIIMESLKAQANDYELEPDVDGEVNSVYIRIK